MHGLANLQDYGFQKVVSVLPSLSFLLGRSQNQLECFVRCDVLAEHRDSDRCLLFVVWAEYLVLFDPACLPLSSGHKF